MKKSARRVQLALEVAGAECRALELPAAARSANEAAVAIGCSVAEIVKSLIFRGIHSNKPVVVLAAGGNRVDEFRVSGFVGESIEKASADFVRDATGYAIGGVPPFGHATPAITIVDEDLMKSNYVWAAAGTPNAVFRIESKLLVELAGGQVFEIKQ
jgi:prolyl-tRNA editing enzyme YbaK/EbsC (Cys-tRNA(Pro) deacylase)